MATVISETEMAIDFLAHQRRGSVEAGPALRRNLSLRTILARLMDGLGGPRLSNQPLAWGSIIITVW
jgi:hypothetical protein